MRHWKWETEVFSDSGYLLNSLDGPIRKSRFTHNSGWAAAQPAIVKGCRRVIWKAIGGMYQIPKLYNRSETAVTPGEYSSHELSTYGVLWLRPAGNVTDTTRGRKPSGAGWNKNLLLWYNFAFSDGIITKGKVCAIYFKNFNDYNEIEIQNSRILQDIGV